MTEYGIYAFADEANASIDLQIEAMKRNALNGVEMRGVDGENVSEITLQKAKEVKEKLDNAGLITWSIGSPIGKINIRDNFEEHKEKLKHTLEVANILEAKNIRFFSFYLPEGAKVEDYKNEVIEKMGELLLIAKDYNINMCHENEKGIFGDIPERCLELHKALPSLKGIFDPANFVQCSVDTLKAWELLKEHIYYMHIKDAVSSGLVVPAGYGIGNLKEIVSDFISRGKNNFTIEPHLTIFNGFKNLEKEDNSTAIDEFKYENDDVAFDAACDAFKAILRS